MADLKHSKGAESETAPSHNTIDFNVNSVLRLTPIQIDEISEINRLLIDGEMIVSAFKTVRDRLIFTNKRILAINVVGVTGKKKVITTMPYSRIQYFTIETPGFAEIMADVVLTLYFVGDFHTTFEFKGSTDIAKLTRVISEYML